MAEISFQQVSKWLRIILTAQLVLGGQARLTSTLTPTLHKRAMSKAEGARKYLSFVPIRDAKQHTRFIGLLMCAAGALLSWHRTRLSGALLSMSLSLMGVYSQWRMAIPYWLPAVNTVLAAVIIQDQVDGRF